MDGFPERGDVESADVLILGAGLTGLAVARHLMGRGLRVAVLEKAARVGGLAKTVAWKGFRADIGGHRIYFKRPALFQDVVSLVGREGLIKHARKSSVYLDGKFLKYPPEFRNSMASASLLARVFWEAARLFGANAPAPRSLKEWVLAHFGLTIHDTYFKQYTRKVWGMETEEMSAIWAEKRIGGLNVFKLIREIAFWTRNKEAASQFYYPRGGIGELCEGLHDSIRGDVRVIRDAELESFGGSRETPNLAHFRSPSGGGCLRFRYLVSTIPIAALAQAMAPLRPDLRSMAEGIRYRDLAIVYVALSRKPVFEEHWVYFPEAGVPFSRVCEMDNWSERMTDGRSALLACELFCGRGDRTWNSTDDELGALTVSSLETLGFAKANEVKDLFVIRVPHAYPLLYLGYEKALTPLRGALEGIPNLWLAGRTGTHSYFDMEECLEDAKRVSMDVLTACHLSPAADRSGKGAGGWSRFLEPDRAC